MVFEQREFYRGFYENGSAIQSTNQSTRLLLLSLICECERYLGWWRSLLETLWDDGGCGGWIRPLRTLSFLGHFFSKLLDIFRKRNWLVQLRPQHVVNEMNQPLKKNCVWRKAQPEVGGVTVGTGHMGDRLEGAAYYWSWRARWKWWMPLFWMLDAMTVKSFVDRNLESFLFSFIVIHVFVHCILYWEAKTVAHNAQYTA